MWLVSRCLLGWMGCVMGVVVYISRGHDNPYLRYGPSDTLMVFAVPVNTWGRYMIVICYTLCSTVVRTVQQDILLPWIIQSVQTDKEKSELALRHGMEIVLIDAAYRWFDWYMYINILLAQVDMLVVEMVGNLVVSYVTTRRYLRKKKLEEVGLLE